MQLSNLLILTGLAFLAPATQALSAIRYESSGSVSNITSFCEGDGSGASCPCGNPGQNGQGCSNATGSGALLSGTGTTQVSLDDLSFSANVVLPNVTSLLFFGTGQVNGGLGNAFGDGLLCAGGSLVRVEALQSNGSGMVQWGSGLASTYGFVAGDARYFQVWYRDPIAGPCGSGFNASNGVEALFVP